jgi:hypothetical protein
LKTPSHPRAKNTIIEKWNDIKAPPPVELKPITIRYD